MSNWVKIDKDEFIKKIRGESGNIVSSVDRADVYIKQFKVLKMFEEMNYPILPEDRFIEEWDKHLEGNNESRESRVLLDINKNLINIGKLLEISVRKSND